jgi:hypothetical protein
LDGGSGQHNRLLRHGETRSGTIREAGSELPSGCGDLLLVSASSFPAQEPGAGRGREVSDADGKCRTRTGSTQAAEGAGHWEDEVLRFYSGAAARATSGGEVVAARELGGEVAAA